MSEPEPDLAPASRGTVAPEVPHAAFTLSFSTGETVRVSGTGLVGRRPIAQPGEAFDQLVALDDPGRSVSKTHLEFGLEGDEMWLLDRYSGNGTIVRPPGGVVRQFEPGRRYRVARGSRVEIGDQYFDVN
ncbi:FHA domain-containing protein [Diaminobutyricibacter sp. McL0618]|uniref:FHA domain-containing protein n=1 Tax=Leifsonia sp. McL0618 TaxID=3415677 RepID=UPI003CF4C72A